MIEIIKVKNNEEMNYVNTIRREVFSDEQGVPEAAEMNGPDKDTINVLAYVEGEPAGCGKLMLSGSEARIGRVAVLKNMRGKGIGTGICRLLMTLASERGAENIISDVQLSAIGFYTYLGFEKAGEAFLEAGIEQVRMTKTI